MLVLTIALEIALPVPPVFNRSFVQIPGMSGKFILQSLYVHPLHFREADAVTSWPFFERRRKKNLAEVELPDIFNEIISVFPSNPFLVCFLRGSELLINGRHGSYER